MWEKKVPQKYGFLSVEGTRDVYEGLNSCWEKKVLQKYGFLGMESPRDVYKGLHSTWKKEILQSMNTLVLKVLGMCIKAYSLHSTWKKKVLQKCRFLGVEGPRDVCEGFLGVQGLQKEMVGGRNF